MKVKVVNKICRSLGHPTTGICGRINRGHLAKRKKLYVKDFDQKYSRVLYRKFCTFALHIIQRF